MDALAVELRAELARFGIETTIVVPGSFTQGTNHFAHSGSPGRQPTSSRPYETPLRRSDGAGRAEAGGARAARRRRRRGRRGDRRRVVGTAKGSRPFRVHIDPSRRRRRRWSTRSPTGSAPSSCAGSVWTTCCTRWRDDRPPRALPAAGVRRSGGAGGTPSARRHARLAGVVCPEALGGDGPDRRREGGAVGAVAGSALRRRLPGPGPGSAGERGRREAGPQSPGPLRVLR